ncbi:MAG: insulinase family protein [Gammaproteobacteria bacterium]|nr:insulinase family protein [Gammaproteobacteria bacterium]
MLLIGCLLFAGTVQASPDIQHWTSSKGARVYYIHAPQLPMVDVRMVFDAGSARDGDKAGLALITNGLLDSGIKGMDEESISAGFEDLGAEFSSSSLKDMALVQLRSLNNEAQLQPALKLFSSLVAAPSFPSKVLDRERSRLLLALKSRQESPGDIAEENFLRLLYGEHAYGRPSEGTRASVAAITRQDLVAFHNSYYVARNAVVAIVGAVDKVQAEAIAEQVTAGLDVGSAAHKIEPVVPLETAVNKRISHPSSQSHILIGQTGMKRGDKDYMALYVGNHILGGSGFGSRIMSEIREKRGLAYSAYSYFVPMREAGPFQMGLQTRNDQVEVAVKVMRSTLQKFVEQGPSEKELRASKKNITGGFPLRIDSNKDLVEYAAMIGFYRLPLDYLESFNQKVEALTLEQIKDAFARRVDPDKMVTVIVGNGK